MNYYPIFDHEYYKTAIFVSVPFWMTPFLSITCNSWESSSYKNIIGVSKKKSIQGDNCITRWVWNWWSEICCCRICSVSDIMIIYLISKQIRKMTKHKKNCTGVSTAIHLLIDKLIKNYSKENWNKWHKHWHYKMCS